MTGTARSTSVRVVTRLDSTASPAALVAESRALLEASARSGIQTLRLFRVAPCVAFGPKDERAPGYAAAADVARRAGFEGVTRLEGGRAVAADAGTLGIAWTVPGDDGRARIRPRFSLLGAALAEALRSLDVDAGVGGVRGEYCPGDFSVHARGEVKLAGLGQRVTAHGAHLGATLVVEGAPRLRAVLASVNAALEVDWDPRTLGSVEEEIGAPMPIEVVAARVLAALARSIDLNPSALDGHSEESP
ncbi:MAG: lipoate--protein ligase family protein [Dehalococcoidia bacterium]